MGQHVRLLHRHEWSLRFPLRARLFHLCESWLALRLRLNVAVLTGVDRAPHEPSLDRIDQDLVRFPLPLI